jgi:hypothetical protein
VERRAAEAVFWVNRDTYEVMVRRGWGRRASRSWGSFQLFANLDQGFREVHVWAGRIVCLRSHGIQMYPFKNGNTGYLAF